MDNVTSQDGADITTENKKMKFKDFENNPQGLVNKYVLYESGVSYSRGIKRSIVRIEKVTKTSFKLCAMPARLFSLKDGSQKGLAGPIDMGIVSECTLLTEEEATDYRETWRLARKERMLREEIKAAIETLAFDQLVKIKELL